MPLLWNLLQDSLRPRASFSGFPASASTEDKMGLSPPNPTHSPATTSKPSPPPWKSECVCVHVCAHMRALT